MDCQSCGEPATVHTCIVDGAAKREIHLCRACAEKQQVVALTPATLPDKLGPLAGSFGILGSDLAKLQCPDCGTKYMDFRKIGRLGCAYDYVVFRTGLLPLLERVHRAVRHRGKAPRKWQRPVEVHDDARALRHRLKQAIEAEEFELAATLRDTIRAKETGHGS